jgi:hypothetical protein
MDDGDKARMGCIVFLSVIGMIVLAVAGNFLFLSCSAS